MRYGAVGCIITNRIDFTDGSQIDDYATKDGVHFNAAGYHAWAEYLATHTVWNRRSVYSGENPYYIYGT